ncbi:hypothetical protein LZZ85_03875 [Terrimonas sp. NA20]|uniref:Uncharacterized protein n=1 Tax=Terrimonas ginsenosidimutans TaxID=2908004 RepID=A0ABS9KM58_9BACT|nr:hypothetical protein [Terrimonas ginsenosidimutans]MCG2613400.1 hypothetical protein [Terrimonas ginsenosidimutans]
MIRNLYVHDCVFEHTRTGLRFKTRRPRGGGGENLFYERIRMNLSGPVFEWDMLGSPAYVGNLAKRLPVLPVTPLTPQFKNITARDIIAEQASQFIKATAIPETPLENVLIENISIRSAKLIRAADVNGFVLKNATIETSDSLISLLDARNMLFENVRFNTGGALLYVDVSGPASAAIKFKNCSPLKPTGWKEANWVRPVSANGKNDQ